jgi:hypothetical protein
MSDTRAFGVDAVRAGRLAAALLVVAVVGAPPAAGAEAEGASPLLAWLAETEAMAPADAARAASEIAAGRARPEIADPGERALLAGAALERAGDVEGARKAYEDARGRSCVPCAASAGLASDLLAARRGDRAAVETVYAQALRQPDAAGWFVIDGKWLESTRRLACAGALVALRAKSISFLFFDAIRARSPLLPEHNYIFVLLVIAVAVRVVALPLHWQQVRTNIVLARLQPQIAVIQARKGDPAANWAELNALYASNGVQFRGPLLLAALNIGYVFLLYFTISAYAPRFVLDGSRLFSSADVTKAAFGITLLAVAVSVILGHLAPQAAKGRARLLQDFSGGVFMLLLAWIFSWPIYVMVFLVLLQGVSGVLDRALYIIRRPSGGAEALPSAG